MTLHAKRHVGQVDRRPDLGHRLYFSVAFLAGNAPGDVRIVVEVYEIADDIDAHPPDRLIALIRLTNPRDLRFVRGHKLMTAHAEPDRWYARCGPTANAAVAILALHFVFAGMNFMAERDGLAGTGLLPGASCLRQRARDEQHCDQRRQELGTYPGGFHDGLFFLRLSSSKADHAPRSGVVARSAETAADVTAGALFPQDDRTCVSTAAISSSVSLL